MENRFFLLTGLVVTIAYILERSESMGVLETTNRRQVGKRSRHTKVHEEYRHVASIRLRPLDRPFGNGHICSGTLFAVNKVLTSADCLIQDVKMLHFFHPSTLRIVIGTVNRFRKRDETVVISHGLRYRYHPDFNVETNENDLCILFFFEGILINHPYVKPLPLSKTLPEVGQSCMVSSWSYDSEVLETSMELQNSQMSIQDRSLCNQSNVGKMICVNDGSRNNKRHYQCLSDLGEGLICNSSVVGVIAYDVSCGISEKVVAVLFTAVAKHLKWIEEATPMILNRGISLFNIQCLYLFGITLGIQLYLYF